MKARKISSNLARALAAFVVLAAGCQKNDSAAPCGTAVASGDTGGALGSAGTTPVLGNAGTLAASGGTGAGGAASAIGGSINLGSGGSGAAAATGGVVESGGSGGAPDSTTCSMLTLDACASNANCQGLSGQPIMGDPLCLGAFQVVACGTKLGCDPTPARATDPQGKDWVFPSSCIPAAWTSSTQSGTRFDSCAPATDPDAGT